jgi:hypothetical protein
MKLPTQYGQRARDQQARKANSARRKEMKKRAEREQKAR